MGLDVALGVIILIAAIRGWLKGFTYQAIRIAGLIACVYLAAPVRDQVKPHILPYLPTIHPDLVERLFWWVAACVTYVVLVGTSTLALKMTKRPEIPGMPAQRSRNDQFAGFLIGILKGALIAAFVTAGIQKYAPKRIETIPWADDQFKSSLALQWNRQFQPASKIWRSVPVRHLVNQVQRMGLDGPEQPASSDATEKAAEERPVVQTARKGPADEAVTLPRSDAPPAPAAAPAETPRQEAAREVEAVLDEVKATLEGASKPN